MCRSVRIKRHLDALQLIHCQHPLCQLREAGVSVKDLVVEEVGIQSFRAQHIRSLAGCTLGVQSSTLAKASTRIILEDHRGNPESRAC